MAAFWEKIKNCLKKPKTPKEGIDFSFFDFPDSDLTGIRLLRGEYQDVIYYYRGVRFSEDTCKLSFEYDIYQTGKLMHTELTTDKKFDKLVGDILTEILVNNEQTRADDTKESYLQ